MAFITLNFDKNFIYVIIYWILEIAFRMVLRFKKEYFIMFGKDEQKDKYDIKNEVKNEYMFVILLNIADLLSIFLVIYIKYSSKGEREKLKLKSEDKIKEENDDIEPKTSKKTLIYEKTITTLSKTFYKKLIIIVILDYISRSSYWISYAITQVDPEKVSHTFQKNITLTFDIFIRYAFSYYMLKVVIYKHRIFSIIMIVIGFALLIINDVLIMKDNIKYDLPKSFLFSAITLISSITFPLENTLMKQIFSKDYIYPANMQFDKGLFEFILIVVVTPILFFSFNLQSDFNFNISLEVALTMILYTISSFVKAFILLKIIYHYSSQSVSFLTISQSLGGSIIRFATNTIENWKYFSCVFEIIGVILILIASLIYDEIIIINRWGLNENVNLGIINRGALEMEEINKIEENPFTNAQTFLHNCDDGNNNEIEKSKTIKNIKDKDFDEIIRYKNTY